MNEDGVVIQPDAEAKPEDAAQDAQPNAPQTADEALLDATASDDSDTPRVFDFSSDFNISPVADDAAKESKPAPAAIPKPPVPAPAPSSAVPPKATMAQPPASLPVAPDEPEKVPDAKPSESYREDAALDQKWPFAFAPSSAGQIPVTAEASSASIAEKSAPMSQPSKTIRASSGVSAEEARAAQPSTNLQRDIFAILPNMSNGQKSDTPAPKSPAQTAASQDPNLKPLRTYEGDIAEALSHRNISTASIAIAENKKKAIHNSIGNRKLDKKAPEPMPKPESEIAPVIEQPVPETREEAFRPAPTPSKIPEGAFKGAVVNEPPEPVLQGPPPSRKLFYIIASLLFVAVGIGGGYYLYMQSPLFKQEAFVSSTTVPAAGAPSNSLVPSDSQVSIAIDGQNPQAIADRIREEIAKPQNPNTLKEILLTQTINGVEGQVSPISIATILGIPVPDALMRTLQPHWMLGIYEDGSGNKNTFVAATTDTFQAALAGMLGWEGFMPNDIKDFLGTGTTTPPQGKFIDEIVKNKDVRAFVTGPDEQTVFLYSFVDNSTLIVANTEIGLAEVVTRLENQVFVR